MSRESGSDFTASLVVLVLLGIPTLIMIFAGGCEDKPRAATVLDHEGYTQITFTGYAWGACADSDSYQTGFRAQNREGKTVTGTVCCGALLKSCTIRY